MTLTKRFKDIWNQKWGRRIIIATVIVLVLSIPMRCRGPYQGRVIDSTTGQPIVGAVAVATWSAMSVNVAGGTTRCLDAAEAVTDETGEFKIKGSRGRFFGLFTGTTHIYIYKVGYERVHCDWNYIKEAGACFEKPGEFDDSRAIFFLKQVPRGKFDTFGCSPPHISCGRKDKKALSAWQNERKKYRIERKKIKESLK